MRASDWMNKSAITSSVTLQFGNNYTLFYRETANKMNKYMIRRFITQSDVLG